MVIASRFAPPDPFSNQTIATCRCLGRLSLCFDCLSCYSHYWRQMWGPIHQNQPVGCHSRLHDYGRVKSQVCVCCQDKRSLTDALSTQALTQGHAHTQKKMSTEAHRSKRVSNFGGAALHTEQPGHTGARPPPEEEVDGSCCALLEPPKHSNHW